MSARVAELTDAGEDDAIETVRDDAPARPRRHDSARTRTTCRSPPSRARSSWADLFLLALLAALYVASPIVLPVVLAIVLKLLLQPLVRLTDRPGVPHALGALLGDPPAGGGHRRADQRRRRSGDVVGRQAAGGTSRRSSSSSPFLARPISSFQWMMGQLQNVGGVGVGVPQAPQEHSFNVMGALFSGTTRSRPACSPRWWCCSTCWCRARRSCVASSRSCRPSREKRQAVEITLDIERNISAYLITVTLINFVVGLLTLGVMWVCGVANPLLWGVIAFVVNFVPILGPMVALVVFLMASVLSLGVTWWALLPVGLYFLVHVVEGEIVTPMLMARRFTINPVAVILALIFWYWMWGVPGAILAVPMLAIIKIVCDDLRPLRAFGHFLEG